MPTPSSNQPNSGFTRRNLLFVGLTAILTGYFLIWLPGPSAGLQIIGIELGEWIKFLGIGPQRNWFYLPPIVAGFSIALLTATWPNNRPQTWVARGLAIVVALLAFPAIAAIQLEPRSEWLARLLAIVLVGVVALTGAWWGGRSSGRRWIWLFMGCLALIGAILPMMQFLAIRPIVAEALRRPVGVGLGVWLNMVGAVLIAFVAFSEFLRELKK